jgi:hypothetical protein
LKHCPCNIPTLPASTSARAHDDDAPGAAGHGDRDGGGLERKRDRLPGRAEPVDLVAVDHDRGGVRAGQQAGDVVGVVPILPSPVGKCPGR